MAKRIAATAATPLQPWGRPVGSVETGPVSLVARRAADVITLTAFVTKTGAEEVLVSFTLSEWAAAELAASLQV